MQLPADIILCVFNQAISYSLPPNLQDYFKIKNGLFSTNSLLQQ